MSLTRVEENKLKKILPDLVALIKRLPSGTSLKNMVRALLDLAEWYNASQSSIVYIPKKLLIIRGSFTQVFPRQRGQHTNIRVDFPTKSVKGVNDRFKNRGMERLVARHLRDRQVEGERIRPDEADKPH